MENNTVNGINGENNYLYVGDNFEFREITFEKLMEDQGDTDVHYVIIQHNMYLESYSRRGIVFTHDESKAIKYDLALAKDMQLKIGGAIIEVRTTHSKTKRDVTNEVK